MFLRNRQSSRGGSFNFDPEAAGLTRVTTALGDFDASDALDVNDVDWLSAKVRSDYSVSIPSWLRWKRELFSVNNDRVVDAEDHRAWVKDLAKTWYGDANLDGEFNTGDLTQVVGVGKYETQQNVLASTVVRVGPTIWVQIQTAGSRA